MRILGIIPARAGSKRVPQKNVRLLNGKPLVEYTIEAGLQSKHITKLIVSTDDPNVVDICAKFPGIQCIIRPAELSADSSPSIDYVKHALQFLSRSEGDQYDIVVILQVTSPLTLPADIDNTIELLLNSDADSTVSVVKLNQLMHPAKLKVLEGQKLIDYFEAENGRMAAQELPEIYVRNGAVYASKISVYEKGKVIGDNCLGYIMPSDRSVDINEEMDFEFLEFLFQKKLRNQVNSKSF